MSETKKNRNRPGWVTIQDDSIIKGKTSTVFFDKTKGADRIMVAGYTSPFGIPVHSHEATLCLSFFNMDGEYLGGMNRHVGIISGAVQDAQKAVEQTFQRYMEVLTS